MLKKIIYGSAWGVLGTEVLIFSTKFYELYQKNTMYCFAGGTGVAPYWLIIEGTMVGFAPIITNHIIKVFKHDGLSDESELAGRIKKINKRKDRSNGVK
jgi:hypothetical protein